MSRRDDSMTKWCAMPPAALAGDPWTTQCVRESLVSGSDWEAFHHRVDERLRSEPGQSALAMRRICAEVGLIAHLHEEFEGSADPLERALAARTLIRLREKMPMDQVRELLDCEDPSTALAAAEAIALAREPRYFMAVLHTLCDRMPGTPSEAGEVLRLFGEDVCPSAHGLLKGVLRQYIDAEDPEASHQVDEANEVDRDDAAAIVVIVEVLAGHGYRPAVPTYSRLLGVCTNDSVRLRLMKAIAAAGDVWAVPASPLAA
jgi:hypothetical protein